VSSARGDGLRLGARDGLRPEVAELRIYVVLLVESFRAGPAKKVKREKNTKIERLLDASGVALCVRASGGGPADGRDGRELTEKDPGRPLVVLKTVVDARYEASGF